jgi:tagaturonate reductase
MGSSVTAEPAVDQLRRSLLDRVRAERKGVVSVPDAALLDPPERIVQFGTGALLRGLIDDFIHRANVAGKFGGRIVAIASTGSARDRALREQDGLYTLVVEGIERGERVEQARIISSVSRALSAADQWGDVLAVARSPLIEYVFSNTTEVGIVADDESLAGDSPPKSFPAKLTRFLYERGRAFDFDAARGVTVIPCELIEDNGARLRDIVLAIARRWELGDAFSAWLDAAVPFCNTLVDRIVPGTPRPENLGRLRGMLGYDDALLTCCEPYCLFAIEGDERLAKRMTWTSVDAGIVVARDIAPYRKRKVHLLNGAHSLLAPVALAMGSETVLDAMSQPEIARFVRHAMLQEIAPTLDVADAAEFAEAVLDRFRNPFIKHALIDIMLQATMKMRVRVVPTVDRFIARTGRVPESLAFGFAGYLAFMEGGIQAARRAKGLPVPADEQSSRLGAFWNSVPEDGSAPVADLVAAIGSDTALWGVDLTSLYGFCDAVAEHLQRIRSQGMPAALAHHVTHIPREI